MEERQERERKRDEGMKNNLTTEKQIQKDGKEKQEWRKKRKEGLRKRMTKRRKRKQKKGQRKGRDVSEERNDSTK